MRSIGLGSLCHSFKKNNIRKCGCLCLFVENRIDGRIDYFSNFCTGAAALPVALLVFVVGFFEAHINVHVNDGHDFTGFVGLVVVGAVKGPAVVEADFAEVVGLLNVGKIGFG